jgi:hypothetical protein
MGILDSFKKAVSTKVDDLDKTYNPMRKVSDAIEESGKQVAPTSSQQSAYEAKEKAMNKNNPFYKVDDSITKKAF